MKSLRFSSDGSHKGTHTCTVPLPLPLSVSCVFSCVKPSGTNVSRPRCCRPSHHLKCVGLRGGNLRSEPSQLDTRASATPLRTPSSLNTTLHTSANPTACSEHSIPYTNRHEPGACQEHVICEYVPRRYIALGTLWHKEWTWCVYLTKTGRFQSCPSGGTFLFWATQ